MLIVGLGNPKESYVGTRHNVGRDFVHYLARQSEKNFEKKKNIETLNLTSFFNQPKDNPVLVIRLKSFMNESGPELNRALSSAAMTLTDTLVVVDDFMIPFGSLRLRSKGSSGGHNGLQSIIDTFQTEEFGRLRVGVGPVPIEKDPAEYVLEPFSKEEKSKQTKLFQCMQDSVKSLLQQGLEKAMAMTNKQHFTLLSSRGR